MQKIEMNTDSDSWMTNTMIFACMMNAAVVDIPTARAQPPDGSSATKTGQSLLAAYPDHLDRIEDGRLFWKDGTSHLFNDGKPAKPHHLWLTQPDIKDMLRQPYPLGPLAGPPQAEVDPGRARNQSFFTKMYGDCRKGEVKRNLVDVFWMRKRAPQKLKVTRINNVARSLQNVSDALETLPKKYAAYLVPSAGTYNCRSIAGTDRLSAHAYGIAIDIALHHADYWRWSNQSAPNKTTAYKNKIPYKIVEIFERHGFIWGGKWHHYDTMHFEYRPEFFPSNRNR